MLRGRAQKIFTKNVSRVISRFVNPGKFCFIFLNLFILFRCFRMYRHHIHERKEKKVPKLSKIVLKILKGEKVGIEERKEKNGDTKHTKWPGTGGLGSPAYLGAERGASGLGSSDPCASECC